MNTLAVGDCAANFGPYDTRSCEGLAGHRTNVQKATVFLMVANSSIFLVADSAKDVMLRLR
jgi:hypothetical protein